MAVTAILISILVVLVAFAYYLLQRHLSYWKRLGIAHDKPSPLTGNFQGLMKKVCFSDVILEKYRKFKGTGPFFGFYFFQRQAVILVDPELIKNVLIKDFSNFTDRGFYHNEKDDPLTGHLFLLDGKKWRIMRNKLSPTFTSGKMKFMFPTVVEVGKKFVATLSDVVKENNIVEIKDILARFTTDVIGSCAFGIECNSLKDPNAAFRQMGRKIFSEPRHGNLLNAFINGLPDLARKLHMRIVPDDINDFFMRIVRETVDYREKNNIQRNDFLNILMELNKGKSLEGENAELRGLTIEEMAAQAFVFFVAGFETSSSTLGFTLYELAQAPEVQQRLREEINEMFKKHNGELAYESMKEMHYMKQVIAETLRKYPIVPMLNRIALQDYPVPGYPNYVIKKGMSVVIPAIGIHRDPEYYPEPEKFDPERFTPEKMEERDSIVWLPFGDGPRNCVGLRFGQMQMRVALTFLLQNFKFTTCSKTEFPLEMNKLTFVLNSQNGIYLKVEQI